MQVWAPFAAAGLKLQDLSQAGEYCQRMTRLDKCHATTCWEQLAVSISWILIPRKRSIIYIDRDLEYMLRQADPVKVSEAFGQGWMVSKPGTTAPAWPAAEPLNAGQTACQFGASQCEAPGECSKALADEKTLGNACGLSVLWP